MQKGQPNARLSLENSDLPNQMYRQETPTNYAQGFSAGYEAGRRASLDEAGTHQRIASTADRRFSAGASHPPQSPRVSAAVRQNRPGASGSPRHGGIPPHPGQEHAHDFDRRPSAGPSGRLSNDFPARRSFDESIRHDHTHEIQGQMTNPDTAVQIKSRGHY